MTKLDKCWKDCLRMWKWVHENLPKGFTKLTFDEKLAILNGLKAQWVTKHRFTRQIIENCFFCDYARTRHGCVRSCPGGMVELGFHCNPSDEKYSWVHNPKGFYRRLVKFDAKRKSGK